MTFDELDRLEAERLEELQYRSSSTGFFGLFHSFIMFMFMNAIPLIFLISKITKNVIMAVKLKKKLCKKTSF